MKIKLYQWRLFALLIGFAFMLQNCQVENLDTPEEIQNSTELSRKAVYNKKDYFQVKDEFFEQVLIDKSIDLSTGTEVDGWVKKSDAENITELLLFISQIEDLSGIEYFVNLTRLIINSSQLESIDLSQNTALTFLSCAGNYSLESLNVSKNTALTYLLVADSDITSLNVRKNTALTDLSLYSNTLTSLDVSGATNLQTLICSVLWFSPVSSLMMSCCLACCS